MTSESEYEGQSDSEFEIAPGDDREAGRSIRAGVVGYLLGLTFAIILTVASFWTAHTHLIYGPGIPVAISVLAVAQMGIHLVFFLHITTAPDNTNTVLALAFGILIAGLVVLGSLWIMMHLHHNVMSIEELMQMQR